MKHGTRTEVRTIQNMALCGYSIFMLQRDFGTNKAHVATSVEFDREIKDYEPFSQPTLNLTEEEAQLMIDSLWDAGLRPAGGHGSAGQLGATETHLKDMQSLVNHLTKGGLK